VVGLGALLSTMGPIMMMVPALTRGFGMMFKSAGGGISTFGKLGAVATAAFIGWEIGKRIGELNIMGKTVNEHVIGAFENLFDKIKGYNKEAEKGEGHTAALEKRQKMLAEASKIADMEITNFNDALDILNNRQTNAEKTALLLAEAEKKVKEEGDEEDLTIKKLGTTIKEMESPFDNFTMQQFQLAQAFGDGEIGMGQYVRRMADLREEREKNLALFDEEEFAIDDAIEGVESYIAEWESVPSALGSVLDQVGINVVGINDDISSSTETTTTNVRNKWTEATDGMITDWSQMFGAFVMSGDLFKGDFTGLFDGIKNVFSDTLGNMLAMFTQDFVQGILSGGTDILGGIGSIFKSTAAAGTDAMGGATSSILGNFGTMAGPLGIGLLAVQLIGMENISKTVQGVWNAVSDVVIGNIKAIGEFGQKILGGLGDMLGGIMSGIGGLAGALGGLGGKKSVLSTTDQWNLDHIQLNTKQLMDYTMIEIGSSGGWLARIHDRLDTLIEKNEYQMKQNRKANDHLKGIDKDTGSIRKDVGKIPGLLSDIKKGIGGLSGAQEGHVSTRPELVMVHGTPQDPEYIFRESQMNNLGGGGGGSNISIVMPSEFNVNGTIIGDREYMRSRLFPEFISMLKSNFGKQELKSALGVS